MRRGKTIVLRDMPPFRRQWVDVDALMEKDGARYVVKGFAEGGVMRGELGDGIGGSECLLTGLALHNIQLCDKRRSDPTNEHERTFPQRDFSFVLRSPWAWGFRR